MRIPRELEGDSCTFLGLHAKILSLGSEVRSPRFSRGQTFDGNEATFEADCQYLGDQQAVLDIVPIERVQIIGDYHGRVLQNIQFGVTVRTDFPD